MDDDIQADIQHQDGLLNRHRARLRVLEDQAARFGSLYVPPHITLEIDELAAKIVACTAQIQQLHQTELHRRVTRLQHQVTVLEQAERFFLVRSAPDLLEKYAGEYQALARWMETATSEIEEILGRSLQGMMVGDISGSLMTASMRLRDELRKTQAAAKGLG